MKLTQFTYRGKDWRLASPINLQEVNLLVGKNAVGKSRTIRALGNVLLFLMQLSERNTLDIFRSELLFEDENDLISYEFRLKGADVVYESLKVNGETLLSRNENGTVLCGESINPPVSKLTLHVRRDVVQYPFIEKIMLWAEHACGLCFNEIEMAGDSAIPFYILGQGQTLFAMVKSLPEKSIQQVIDQAHELGYPIQRIELFEHGSNLKMVLFHEENVKSQLFDALMSKGMFRALYLLIYAQYMSVREFPSLLLIDDLCEGLDYDRSTKLGKILFDFCIEHHIQLIASSNDTFLMDVVDLKYWNILQREGSEVSSIDIIKNPDLFNDFLFTGLSNFDFFSSDYITRKKEGL
ncbi:AAA family ATPase [Bacteroides acidifaciens]|uniref:ATP-binding protein n=1 Tax=Bacteroides acidifaciens TaxID=85831 RepID=A0A3L7Z4S7_9BACE|nr:AAA family ATPase [Bacteroides acidifaciens]RLT80500.1 ATP-binding protein [Bacteroides acidifaciens]